MDTWAYYDPKGRGKISMNDILFFIVDLKPPFGQHYKLRMPIKESLDLTTEYLVNKPKGYCVKRVHLMKVVKDYKLKAVKDNDGLYYVLFADIYKEFIKKAFEFHKFSKFKVSSTKMKQKLKKGWKKQGQEDEIRRQHGIIMRNLAASAIQ